ERVFRNVPGRGRPAAAAVPPPSSRRAARAQRRRRGHLNHGNPMSDLNAKVSTTRAILEQVARDYSPAVFASSLAAEDMVLTDLILKNKLDIGIFSLETGRLHPETLAVLDAVKATYGHDIALYRPLAESV